MAEELPYVDLALPDGVTDLKFYGLGLAERNRWPLDVLLDRIAVVSPFVEEALLAWLAEQTRFAVLVARLPELQRLPHVRGSGSMRF